MFFRILALACFYYFCIFFPWSRSRFSWVEVLLPAEQSFIEIFSSHSGVVWWPFRDWCLPMWMVLHLLGCLVGVHIRVLRLVGCVVIWRFLLLLDLLCVLRQTIFSSWRVLYPIPSLPCPWLLLFRIAWVHSTVWQVLGWTRMPRGWDRCLQDRLCISRSGLIVTGSLRLMLYHPFTFLWDCMPYVAINDNVRRFQWYRGPLLVSTSIELLPESP